MQPNQFTDEPRHTRDHCLGTFVAYMRTGNRKEAARDRGLTFAAARYCLRNVRAFTGADTALECAWVLRKEIGAM